MKIAMFTDAYWPRVNGVTVSVDSFSRALVNAGQDVLIVCSTYPENTNIHASYQKESEADSRLKIIRIPSVPALVTKEDRLVKFNKWHWVFRQVELFDPDIIHINTEMVVGEFGLWYSKTHNLPLIYTFHTMWEDYGPNYFPIFPVFLIKFIIRRVLKHILKRSYRVIAPTPQIESVVQKLRVNKQIYLLPTGIEMDLFDHDKAEIEAFREKLEERFPQLKKKRILLFAGRVAREKNIEFLFNILPEILKKHPDVILLIAGNGPDLSYYQEEAQRTGIKDFCVFTGNFPREDLALVYGLSEIFVFPSLTDTQGLVTLEAMLSGIPVVAIGALGTLAVMNGNNGGFMVENDAAEFTGRVMELLGDPELYNQKSIEAKRHARSWSIDELTKKLIVIYESTITSYLSEHGERITPVWELLMDKRWWKINNKIIQKRTRRNWQKVLSKLKIQ
jgi:glycosyltransferase involved in cell wall biosynthesis